MTAGAEAADAGTLRPRRSHEVPNQLVRNAVKCKLSYYIFFKKKCPRETNSCVLQHLRVAPRAALRSVAAPALGWHAGCRAGVHGGRPHQALRTAEHHPEMLLTMEVDGAKHFSFSRFACAF